MLEKVLLNCVTVFLLLGSSLLWWTVKREAVRHDWPLLWDVADLVGGMVSAVACYALVRPLVVFRPSQGVTTDPALFALRSAAAFGFAMFLGFWVASMYVEAETERGLPASLDPLEERVYEMHLGWVPFDAPPEERDDKSRAGVTD